MQCDRCAGEAFTKAGRDRLGRQLWRCRSCGRRRTARSASAFSGYRFPAEVIALAVRWYRRFRLSYADLAEGLAERGIAVDPSTSYDWVPAFTPRFIEAARRHRHPIGPTWRVDEPLFTIGGRWRYAFRASDEDGQISVASSACLVEEVSDEIARGAPRQVVARPLIGAKAKEYVRQTQERLIGAPILQLLNAQLGERGTQQRLLDLLESWRGRPADEQGYGPANAVNLLRLMRGGDLRGMDLSRLSIRRAYLAGVEAQGASLAGAHLLDSVLADFAAPTCVARLLTTRGTIRNRWVLQVVRS